MHIGIGGDGLDRKPFRVELLSRSLNAPCFVQIVPSWFVSWPEVELPNGIAYAPSGHNHQIDAAARSRQNAASGRDSRARLQEATGLSIDPFVRAGAGYGEKYCAPAALLDGEMRGLASSGRRGCRAAALSGTLVCMDSP